MSSLKLNCWILGEGHNHILRVEIARTELVGTLQKAVKNERPHAFHNIDADTFDLWKVSIPIDKSFKERLGKLDLDLENPLMTVDRLSALFPDGPKDEHLHIIVKPPSGRPSPFSEPQPVLALNCWVLGDDHNRIIPVEIARTQSVGILKKAVKNEKPHAFHTVDADTLDLWKVSIPVDECFEETLGKLDLDLEKPLMSVKRLSALFPEGPANEHLHIVVRVPHIRTGSPSRSSLIQEESEEQRDTITALKITYKNTVAKIRNAKVPSKSATSNEYAIYQRNLPIYDGRYDVEHPMDTIAPPIELYHPVFADFLDDLKGDLHVPDEVRLATFRYMGAASAVFGSENERRLVTGRLLREILGMGMSTVLNTDKTSPDFLVEVSLSGEAPESIASLLVEEKRDLGSGSSDPTTQAGLSMARYWVQPEHTVVRDNTCCPMFLFANAGPWIAILGAVFTDKVIVKRLTPFYWVGRDSWLYEPSLNQIAHIMNSLKRSVRKLLDYYRGLKLINVGDNVVHPRFVPSICAYLDDERRVVKFKYIKPLETHPMCVTFLTQTLVDPPKQVVVKFVYHYGDKAHRILAKENMAPQLLYFGQVGVQEGDPSYGHLRMVVMEYIDGTTLEKAQENGQVPKTVKPKIRAILKQLHDNGFVFGDLRPPNVMITKNEDVKLIDFDWAGVHMVSQYPLMMSSRLDWPTGVGPLSVMDKRHDNDMLARLLVTE